MDRIQQAKDWLSRHPDCRAVKGDIALACTDLGFWYDGVNGNPNSTGLIPWKEMDDTDVD